MVAGKSDDHAFHLQTQPDVEILGHVRIGPPFLLPVRGIDKRDALKRFPANECVVPDKRRNISTPNTVLDGGVDDVGEIGNWLRQQSFSFRQSFCRRLTPVFEHAVDDLHDT